MRVVKVTSKKMKTANGKDVYLKFVQDNGSRWSIWVRNDLVGKEVAIDTAYTLDDVLRILRSYRREPDSYKVEYSTTM